MIWISVLLLVFVALILFWVAPRISEYRATLGIDEQIAEAGKFRDRLWLRIKGLKTIIVGVIGALAIAIPEALQMFAGINLAPLIGGDWNAKVGVCIAIGTAITHVVGIVSSAKAEPMKEPE